MPSSPGPLLVLACALVGGGELSARAAPLGRRASPPPLAAPLAPAPAPAPPAKCARCEHGEQHPLHPPPFDPGALPLLRMGAPPAILPFAAEAPTSGVNITTNVLLREVMEANIDYLLTAFDSDHLLLPFRQRAGKPNPPTGSRPQGHFWDTDLQGSNAGRFLMGAAPLLRCCSVISCCLCSVLPLTCHHHRVGRAHTSHTGAGNTLRWLPDPALRAMVDVVVDGIEDCRNESTGYILAYEPAGFMHSEQGDYGRSWFTQGLIEVGKAGHHQVWPLLRGMYDWFDDPAKNPYQPYLYDGISNGEQGQIASTRMYRLRHISSTRTGTLD
jgi:hypothetical protein